MAGMAGHVADAQAAVIARWNDHPMCGMMPGMIPAWIEGRQSLSGPCRMEIERRARVRPAVEIERMTRSLTGVDRQIDGLDKVRLSGSQAA